MLRTLSGVVAVTICFVLVGQGVSQDDKKPDVFGKIKTITKAAEGEKGLGTLTITPGKKGEESEDVMIKIGKKTEIMKGAKDAEPMKMEFSDLKEGMRVGVWKGEEGKAAKKVMIFAFKKKKDV